MRDDEALYAPLQKTVKALPEKIVLCSLGRPSKILEDTIHKDGTGSGLSIDSDRVAPGWLSAIVLNHHPAAIDALSAPGSGLVLRPSNDYQLMPN